ncbi:RNA-binding region-containing protein 3 [Mactra antiquata]
MAGSSTTLLVRHLPSELSDQEKIEFLCHFGANSVQVMGSHGQMKHCAFARYASLEAAEKSLKRLHQLEVLGCRLVVEMAKENIKDMLSDDLMKGPMKIAPSSEDKKDDKTRETTHTNKDDAFNKHYIPYPKKPTLCYMYPPPTVSILANIANALASHSKFYTQVLHLMNKMNLPCPFGAVTPSPPLALEKSGSEPVKRSYTETSGDIDEVEMEYASSEESEIESDTQENVKGAEKLEKPLKNMLKRPRKRLRINQQQLPVVQNPGVTHNPSEVFETATNVKQGQIQFNLSERDIYNQLEQSKANTERLKHEENKDNVIIEGGFGKVEPKKAEESKTEVEKPDVDYKIDRSLFLTKKDIYDGRLKKEQLKDFNVFKKYSSGEVTSRLYIKNLTKHTNEQDLVNLFGSFIDWSKDLAVEAFDVRVMKEGRMKGQAFVTLPSDEEAEKIVQECNGFILNSKPMVIQFARSAKAKQVDIPVE